MADVNMSELQKVGYGSFPEIFGKIRSLADQYGGLSPDALIKAFGMVPGFGSMYTPNPYVQNDRVKSISSEPVNYGKDKLVKMLAEPDSNEIGLRQAEHALEYAAYPLFHTRTVYANLLTYHNYVAPFLVDKGDTKRDDFWREWKLLEKLRDALQIKDRAHEITGQALQEGKVFYTPRISVDKAHNSINYAYLQQLPSDWTKIVGFNNRSKYTVAFNLMYFCKYGTDYRQFGDLFEPYMASFFDVIYPAPRQRGNGKIIYAAKTAVDLKKMAKTANNAEAYFQNGQWFYWVTLPVDRVFPFEIDDTNRAVVPPLSALFIDLIQLAQMEEIQLNLLQNPLVSLLHGEIPYWDDRNTNDSDQYKLSNAGRLLFEALWYQMLQANNTNGIGLYMAPLENMKLEALSEAPNATEVVSKGLQDLTVKSGLAALIPSSADARAGAVNVSFKIESRFPMTVYACWERMMRVIIDGLNLRYAWRFNIFGDLATDPETEEAAVKGMEHGILPDTIIYNALKDRSIMEDIAMSDAIDASGLLKRRKPLVTSFSQSAKSIGRPPAEDMGSSDGHEQDTDLTG